MGGAQPGGSIPQQYGMVSCFLRYFASRLVNEETTRADFPSRLFFFPLPLFQQPNMYGMPPNAYGQYAFAGYPGFQQQGQ